MTIKKSLPLFIAVFSILAFVPLFAFAQNISSVLATILNIINTIILMLMVVATLFFIWGVVTYILKADKEEGKKKIINGLIGLFIIVAFWGIIRIVRNTFGLTGPNVMPAQDIPCIQGVNC